MSEIEYNVWRTMRVLTTLTVLVVLLLIAGSIADVFDLSLAGSWGGSTSVPPLQEPSGPGVRVQSYAEIIPGGQQMAHAWALGPDQQGHMSSSTVADAQQLSAAAASVWPRASTSSASTSSTAAAEGRSGLGEKVAVVTATPASPPMVASPVFVVQQPLVNLRGGPGTEYAIVDTATAGARYVIRARYGEWWQVDANGGVAWLHGALGVTAGDTSAVPTAVTSAGSVTGAVTVAVTGSGTEAPTATPTRWPGYAYGVEMTRHPESNTVVIYALIQDDQAIVGDLFLSVEHNGQRWRSGPSSYAVQGVTKPAEPSSPYNRTYNAKIDFPLFLFPVLDMTGTWAVTLVDGAGQPLSVSSTVTIAPGDQQREIYLHYRKVKL